MGEFAVYLFIFSIGAFFIPLVSRALHIPAVIGEIFYGFLLHRFLDIDLNFSPFLNFFSEMGFIFLMFLAGLELNFENFKKKILIKSILIILLFYFLVYFWVSNVYPENPIIIFIIFSTMSVGMVFLSLKSTGLEASEYGQTMIWVASIGELFSILMIIAYEVYHGNNQKLSIEFVTQLGFIAVLFLGAYIGIRLILLFFWRFPAAVYLMEEDGSTSEPAVRLSFLVLLSMVALSAFFRLELILGAFLGGMMLSFVFRDKKILIDKMSSIGYGFFIPFFFIKLGWDFQINKDMLDVLILNSIFIYTFLLVTRLILSAGIHKWSFNDKFINASLEIISGSFILSAPLTLFIAIAEISHKHMMISDILHQSIIFTAIAGGLIGPIIFNLYHLKIKRH